MGSFKRKLSRTKVSFKSLDRDWDRMHAAFEAGNHAEAEQLAERVHGASPDVPDTVLALGQARLACSRPAMALRLFEEVVRRWPSHEGCANARIAISKIREFTDELIEKEQLGRDGLDVLVDHEKVQLLMARGKQAESRQLAERLVARCPYVPAINNLSLLLVADGDLEGAIAQSRRALARKPDDLFSRCTLAEALHMLGHADEARTVAAPLRTNLPDRSDAFAKAAHTFSVLGDDEAVLDLHARATGELMEAVHHFAAVACARQGREDEARRLWRLARQVNPHHVISRLNLDDLERPVGERNGPWALPSTSWMPMRVADEVKRGSSSSAFRTILSLHPLLSTIAPYLAEQGDPMAVPMLVSLAEFTEEPRLIALLPRIATGRRGSDQERLRAATLALRLGIMQPGPITVWKDGARRELHLLGLEITTEPTTEHTPQVAELCTRAQEASRNGDHGTAERLLSEALVLAPAERDLINNRAAVLHALGRTDEAEDILRQLNARDPRYLHAAATLAGIAMERGRYDEVRRLLTPLFEVQRLHLTEHALLCETWIRLHRAEGNPAKARGWLDQWRAVDEDDPRILVWEGLLAALAVNDGGG